MYPPELVAPMKADLTEAGMTELLSPEAEDAALNESGTTLVVINSVFGFALSYIPLYNLIHIFILLWL